MIESTGLLPEVQKSSDLLYSDVMGMATEQPVDWAAGYDAFQDLGIAPIIQDQNGSLSCTGQAMKSYARRWIKELLNNADERSARWIYAQTHLTGGGATLRDAIALVANKGAIQESLVPSYDNGKPPSETFMEALTDTPNLDAEAKIFDKFTYRLIPGQTNDINIFAHAIRNNNGVLGGFTVSDGWGQPVVRLPKDGENIAGHAVDLCAYGLLDVDDWVPKGTKCVFTPNSWGNRYGLTKGRWKGYQAIPEDYFLASINTAAGPAVGYYVFNSWCLVPDAVLPPNQQLMDFLQKNEGKLVQLTESGVSESGSIGLLVNGKLLVTSPERAGLLALTKLLRDGGGLGVDKNMWDNIPKGIF